jgi:hypothetical protein
VRTVVRFFQRIKYVIGGMQFSPDDIEHGILRGNRPPPGRKKPQFGAADRRSSLRVHAFDPRIHFALVCAASSCPPVAFYAAADIDEQLATAGRSFMQRKGIAIDAANRVVYLSRVFQWYGTDFGRTPGEVLRTALSYADEESRAYAERHSGELTVRYLPYNWNLNARLETS